MKKMSCRQLGGACNQEFMAATFEEIAKLSQQHARQMFQQNDKAHIDAMQQMQALMQNPEDMNRWMHEKKELFTSLPSC